MSSDEKDSSQVLIRSKDFQKTSKASSPTPQTRIVGSESKRPNAGQSLRTRDSQAWQSLAKFEEAVGGREKLAETISFAPKTRVQERILGLMGDPVRAMDSLARICADAGVHANEILTLFREGNFARAYAQAHQTIAERIPGVIEDVATKAVDHFDPCECRLTEDGWGDRAVIGCASCKGTGLVPKKASIDHQTLLLEVGEMLKKGPGVAVNVQQNVGVGFGDEFFSKLVKATDAAATDVIDGEIAK